MDRYDPVYDPVAERGYWLLTFLGVPTEVPSTCDGERMLPLAKRIVRIIVGFSTILVGGAVLGRLLKHILWEEE